MVSADLFLQVNQFFHLLDEPGLNLVNWCNWSTVAPLRKASYEELPLAVVRAAARGVRGGAVVKVLGKARP